MTQPTTTPLTNLGHYEPHNASALELQAQTAALYVALHLTNRALAAGLTAPWWTIDPTGSLTAEFTGPHALRDLDRWRRQLPDAATASARKLHEVRWTVTALVQAVSVQLVAVVPASVRTAVPA
ncbi:hypothetical protein [Kitasatospora sp. MBT66]|uniref:hypothetical protein n=1 Tax=Kitasatospora sp. MBT66 TaxID=1444769 RepID=UPI0005B7C14C|nr:hypothetical protein [Kitasatospora sp. MBT66]